jgi:hypothetical protein
VFWQPAQLRVWNAFGWVDIVVMVALIAPFLAMRWVLPSPIKATRVAWWLAAIMAADVLFFVIPRFASGGGHPSLESLLLYYSSLLKAALVPGALAALCVALTKSERLFVIVLGVVCLVCETVYMVPGPEHPVRQLLVRK